VFVGCSDSYMLRQTDESSDKSYSGSGNWESIGTDEEGTMKMLDYMTYDEIKLSSLLLQVSSPVFPINAYVQATCYLKMHARVS
jgi:Domain of unknown function (DUF4804)